MKRFSQTLWLVVLVVVLSSSFLMPRAFASELSDRMQTISEYSIMWGDPSEGLESVMGSSPERWKIVKSGEAIPKKPKDITTAWIRIKLPSQIPENYGMFIQGLYAEHLTVYIGHRLVQESMIGFSYDQQSSLFPISSEDGGKTILMKLETSMGRLGIISAIALDDYDILLRSYILGDLQNIILGCAFLFIASIMLLGSIFLKRVNLTDWILVSVLFVSLGIIFITYTPFLYASFPKYGAIFSASFDIYLMFFYRH
jgi:two-component system sporulation sensor kinase B